MSIPITVRPRRAIVPFDLGKGDGASRIVVECSATDSFGVLEIGKRYIFASRKNRPIFNRRHTSDFSLWLVRRRLLAEEAAIRMGLGENKIGEMEFVPASPKLEFGPALRAGLNARIYPNDSDFDSLLEIFRADKRPATIQIHVASLSDGELRYGWEPDGSRKEWGFDDSESRTVDITGFETNIELFRT